jgi:hypothetical protein
MAERKRKRIVVEDEDSDEERSNLQHSADAEAAADVQQQKRPRAKAEMPESDTRTRADALLRSGAIQETDYEDYVAFLQSRAAPAAAAAASPAPKEKPPQQAQSPASALSLGHFHDLFRAQLAAETHRQSAAHNWTAPLGFACVRAPQAHKQLQKLSLKNLRALSLSLDANDLADSAATLAYLERFERLNLFELCLTGDEHRPTCVSNEHSKTFKDWSKKVRTWRQLRCFLFSSAVTLGDVFETGVARVCKNSQVLAHLGMHTRARFSTVLTRDLDLESAVSRDQTLQSLRFVEEGALVRKMTDARDPGTFTGYNLLRLVSNCAYVRWQSPFLAPGSNMTGLRLWRPSPDTFVFRGSAEYFFSNTRTSSQVGTRWLRLDSVWSTRGGLPPSKVPATPDQRVRVELDFLALDERYGTSCLRSAQYADVRQEPYRRAPNGAQLADDAATHAANAEWRASHVTTQAERSILRLCPRELWVQSWETLLRLCKEASSSWIDLGVVRVLHVDARDHDNVGDVSAWLAHVFAAGLVPGAVRVGGGLRVNHPASVRARLDHWQAEATRAGHAVAVEWLSDDVLSMERELAEREQAALMTRGLAIVNPCRSCFGEAACAESDVSADASTAERVRHEHTAANQRSQKREQEKADRARQREEDERQFKESMRDHQRRYWNEYGRKHGVDPDQAWRDYDRSYASGNAHAWDERDTKPAAAAAQPPPVKPLQERVYDQLLDLLAKHRWTDEKVRATFRRRLSLVISRDKCGRAPLRREDLANASNTLAQARSSTLSTLWETLVRRLLELFPPEHNTDPAICQELSKAIFAE